MARFGACSSAAAGPASEAIASSSFSAASAAVVAVEDARDLLHLLTERAVRARRAVRGRAPADDTRALCCDELCEFERDSRLADPGRAEDRDEVAPSLVDDAVPDSCENCELAIASDHRNGRGRALPDGRRGAKSEPRLHRRLLPLRNDRLRRAVLDGAARPDVRLLADEHRPDRRRRLQTGCGVHDVSGNEGLATLGTGVECDDRLARVDRDAQLEPFVLGPVANGKSGAHGPLGVVAVRHRRTENAHHGIADELLDLPAVALELAAHALVVGDEERANVLRVELLGARGEADEVDEQHRHDAALLAGRPWLPERGATRVAELRPVGILLAAAGAREHGVEH